MHLPVSALRGNKKIVNPKLFTMKIPAKTFTPEKALKLLLGHHLEFCQNKHISCRNYFCRIANFGDILNQNHSHCNFLQVKDFQYGGSDLEP